MAASEAIIGYGTIFSVENAAGSGVYVELAEVTGVTPPNESVDEVEVTHMQSPGRTKEKISGLIDPGDMSVEMNYIPNSVTDAFLLAWKASGENRSCRITYPASTGAVDTFPAYYKGFSPTMGVGDKLAGTLTLGVAGAVVRS